jgi:hypothetical protein
LSTQESRLEECDLAERQRPCKCRYTQKAIAEGETTAREEDENVRAVDGFGLWLLLLLLLQRFDQSWRKRFVGLQ